MNTRFTRNTLRWLGIACGILVGWSAVSRLLGKSSSFKTSPELTATVNGNTAFALDLYQKLRTQPGNVFFSPYSISAALAMTHAGARGDTETEMAKALHFDLSQKNLHESFGDLAERMEKIERWNRITLTSANSLWCQKGYHLSASFVDLIRNSYKGEAQSVDFQHDAQSASLEINRWVERNTNGKIKGISTTDQFDSNTGLVLCNAMYFKGKWKTQFNLAETKPGRFYISETNSVTVPMMSAKADVRSLKSDTIPVELLELPYQGGDISMIILLPGMLFEDDAQPKHATLSDLEKLLTVEALRSWLKDMDQTSPRKMHISIPRFTTARRFDLTLTLQGLGMVSAFKNWSDFSGMDGTRLLYLSQVIHEACVDVNEEGTEAAATTFSLVKSRSSIESFIADGPFLFLIRDNESGSILFLGRIVDPTK